MRRLEALLILTAALYSDWGSKTDLEDGEVHTANSLKATDNCSLALESYIPFEDDYNFDEIKPRGFIVFSNALNKTNLVSYINSTFNFSNKLDTIYNYTSSKLSSLASAKGVSSLILKSLAFCFIGLPVLAFFLYFFLVLIFPDPASDSKFERDVSLVVRHMGKIASSFEDGIFDLLEDLTDPDKGMLPEGYGYNENNYMSMSRPQKGNSGYQTSQNYNPAIPGVSSYSSVPSETELLRGSQSLGPPLEKAIPLSSMIKEAAASQSPSLFNPKYQHVQSSNHVPNYFHQQQLFQYQQEQEALRHKQQQQQQQLLYQKQQQLQHQQHVQNKLNSEQYQQHKINHLRYPNQQHPQNQIHYLQQQESQLKYHQQLKSQLHYQQQKQNHLQYQQQQNQQQLNLVHHQFRPSPRVLEQPLPNSYILPYSNIQERGTYYTTNKSFLFGGNTRKYGPRMEKHANRNSAQTSSKINLIKGKSMKRQGRISYLEQPARKTETTMNTFRPLPQDFSSP